MIDDTKNQAVLEQVIPPLCSFMTMKNILRIQQDQAADEKAD